MIPFQKETVAVRRKLWTAPPGTGISTHGRVVPDGEELFRYAWILVYRNGSSLFQYHQVGEHLIQEAFADAQKVGIKHVLVFDLHASIEQPIAVLNIPEDAEADILYNNRIDVAGDRILGRRIYTFGWLIPGQTACEYFHIDPSTNPPRIMRSKRRML